jgi:hypothetical protein
MRPIFPLILVPLALCAECRTPLGVPCHTLHYTQSSWRGLRGGWSGFKRSQTTGYEASRSDGSQVGAIVQVYTVNFKDGRQTRPGISGIFFSGSREIVRLHHEKKVFTRRESLIWSDFPYRRSVNGDSTCASGIKHFGTHFHYIGEDTFLGLKVHRWSGGYGEGGSWDVYLAPRLDCQPLKYKMIDYKWNLPVEWVKYEATSVEFGEPKDSLFQIPSDYTRTIDPDESRIRTLEYNRRMKIQESQMAKPTSPPSGLKLKLK